MGLKGKLISETEIKGGGDMFHEMFRHKPHHLPKVCPALTKAVDLHQGDWGTVGSVLNWNYTHATERVYGAMKLCEYAIIADGDRR